MRAFCLVAALAVLTFGSVARAQNTITISRVFRNSPRNAEVIGGVPATDPIGLRDCSCESWEFTIDYTLPSAASTSSVMSWWVGTSDSACTTSAGRSTLNPATQTCFQLLDASIQPAPFTPGGQGTVRVTVPSRFLVNPIDGSCTPLSTRSTTDTLYFTVIVTPPGDPPAAIATKAITYNVTVPPEPFNVAAAAEEGAAKVTWTTVESTVSDGGTTTLDEAGNVTSTLPVSVTGFYVLCLPRPPSWDAGVATSCDGSVVTFDASTTDVQDVADVSSVTDVTDVTDVAADGEAGVAVDSGDAGTDAAVEASVADVTGTDTGSDGSGNVECTMNLPADFNPNDPNQFDQYVCSPLLGRSSTSYDVTGLLNGSTYRFAVVSQDNAGNRSIAAVSSNCTTPELVTDFWEHYHDRGGQAQPGFCSARPGPVGRAGFFAWAIAALGAVSVARRRRRRTDGANARSRRGDA